MKKIFSILFIAILIIGLTGCSMGGKKNKDKASKKASCQELITLYERAYNEEKVELIKEVFPDFFFKGIEDELTVESLKRAKSYYGEDAKMTINAKCEKKMDDEWIERNQAILKEYYDTDVKVKECYELEGTSTIKGSKDEHTGDIEEMWYCNFDGTWRLIAG